MRKLIESTLVSLDGVHRIEAQRAIGQPVLVPVGIGAITNALEHPIGDELAQAVGEHVACDA